METTMINDMEKDVLYDLYDQAINAVLVNIYTLTKNDGQIILSDIDKKNKNHLLILRVALMAKDIYNFPLNIKTSLWHWTMLNWKMRKLTRVVPREKEKEINVEVQDLIDFMTPVLKQAINEDFEFANIYEAFYEGDLD